MRLLVLGFIVLIAASTLLAADGGKVARFNPELDFISLHYDHAPDKDDGHSAAADRTILESLYSRDWIKSHVAPVSGAYGKNADRFQEKSDAVMDVAWNDCSGWLDGHSDWEEAVADLYKRWTAALNAGGDVWVKEGGQSDITADVIKRIKVDTPDIDTTTRIHVVQHSTWNEKHTTDSALAYTKKQADYIRIADANSCLNIKGGDAVFEKAAIAHPVYGPAWKSAFEYYNPKHRLDFSDTGELMIILDLGKMGIEDFRKRFLDAKAK